MDQRVKRERSGSVPDLEVARSYVDVWQREQEIAEDIRAELASALGPPRKAARLKVEAGPCYQPGVLRRGARLWGFALQLYGVRSERNWGFGDFGDLRRLVEMGARLGQSVVGVNPLHATERSPYSPISRHALDFRYLDVEALPQFQASKAARRLAGSRAFRKQLNRLRQSELVDHAGVGRAKREVLELAYRECGEQPELPTRQLRGFALFEALREKLGGGWQNWPREYQDPAAPAVKRFARQHARRVAFHGWVQMRAREQLDALQAQAHELGMPVGLYVDLALGSDRGGAEVWSDRGAFALDVSCGAPPDEFNPLGQDWGLPPYSPRALRASGYRPFIDLLRANMPQHGALRIDHVLGLLRLWWIPLGRKPREGGYVSYPFRELLAVLAAESRARNCLVIGEDLGTVPPDLRKALDEAGVLSYRPLIFEREFPRQALACVTTHDLPTWKGFWAARDLDLRRSLELSPDPEKELAQRRAELERLRAVGVNESPNSAHAVIARSNAMLAVVQPEDVLEVGEQANLPGTVDQHPNWRRKLPLELERWEGDARMRALAALFPRDEPLVTPVATYRVQLHTGFTFRDATALVPYLAKLGISHLYTSPFLAARPGSTHGYDVIDHNAVNPELGSEAELAELVSALERHGMGLVADLVPNHMGVLHADNAWWLDVLEKGRASPYARFFDIDWRPGKLLLPVLGKHYGEALEAGEFTLSRDGRSLRYFDQRFPLRERSPPVKTALAMHRLLERQHYRLAYWRVASDEINYRRFFEITDLAGVRVEDPAVFAATHALIRRLARRGGIDGLRIDHPDGLADPRQYLERLAGAFHRPWIVVEKILAEHEPMIEDWPVHGTTGYRFANLATGVFVDGAAEGRIERVYQRFTGERRSFEEIAVESRMLIMRTTLAAELRTLAAWLARIAAGSRFTRDYTESGLARALAEVAAHFPVYRTYVSQRGASDTDRRHIDWAVGAARRASRTADPGVFDFVRSVLTLEAAPPSGPRRAEMLRFAMRFQQFTAPVVAKGIEDTAFYRYNRLIVLNEVGGHPARFGTSLKTFHAHQEHRARRWGRTMLGSSTHDTKRSEDVRARLALIPELASAWRMLLPRWSRINRSHRTELDGGESAPSRNDEYHYYQALIGIWPHHTPERLKAYMLKAAREAKLRTSWINPDTAYEAALERFIEQSLANPLFRRELDEHLPRFARLGMLVGLSQTLLKVASPGVPDFYQGSETWDFSLVDPDNRRPVEYGVRTTLLKQLENGVSPHELLENLDDGRAKMHVIRKGLELRRKWPQLFHGAGEYTPLHADGGREENVIAFRLSDGSHSVLAVAPRLFTKLVANGDPAPLGAGAWGDARIVLPASGRYENVLTGERHQGAELRLAELLASFPVALLASAA